MFQIVETEIKLYGHMHEPYFHIKSDARLTIVSAMSEWPKTLACLKFLEADNVAS